MTILDALLQGVAVARRAGGIVTLQRAGVGLAGLGTEQFLFNVVDSDTGLAFHFGIQGLGLGLCGGCGHGGNWIRWVEEGVSNSRWQTRWDGYGGGAAFAHCAFCRSRFVASRGVL